jgi:uncharacterized protein YbaP (TraB family)
MRRQIIVIFFSLFCLTLPPAWAADRGALFKLEGSGHTMYLFGTMHVGQPDFYPLEPRIAAAVAGASALALAEYSMQGYRPELSVDLHLAQLARASQVKVIELESAGAQMALFSHLSDAEQWRFLEETIELIESGRQQTQVRQVVDAWRTADKAALDTIAERAENDTSLSGRFFQQVLLDGRNGPMAGKLAQLLARENNSVAAIGVLHLLGKNSVPALLRARGVKVERVY